MHSDRLYELAFRFRDEKPWKILKEENLFALKLSNGKTAYCSVTGAVSGSHTALIVYVGKKGFQSIYRTREFVETGNSFIDMYELLSQDCIQCIVEPEKDYIEPHELRDLKSYAKAHGYKFSKVANPYLNFESYQPECAPWTISAKEESILMEALEATLHVVDSLKTKSMKELGLCDSTMNCICPILERTGDTYQWSTTVCPERMEIKYPEPKDLDEFTAFDIRKKRKSGTACVKIVYLPEPMRMKGKVPRLPSVLIVADMQNGNAYPIALEQNYTEDPDAYLRELTVFMKENRLYPKTIFVDDDRTQTFLKGLCESCSIDLVREEHLDEFDEILAEFEKSMGMGSSGAGSDGFDPDRLEGLVAMISSQTDEEILEMPADIREAVLFMADTGMLPLELTDRLSRLFR